MKLRLLTTTALALALVAPATLAALGTVEIVDDLARPIELATPT